MVLHLKVWESRTLPGLPRSEHPKRSEIFNLSRSRSSKTPAIFKTTAGVAVSGSANCDHENLDPIAAGWSSLVARQAHNLKVVGSNPAPATIFSFDFIR